MAEPALHIVRRYLSLYRSRDREACTRLLGEAFTFTSPNDDHIDQRAYFERCWPPGDTVKRFEVTHMVASGNEVFVRYLAKWPDQPAFHNVERFCVEDGRIALIEVYFGAAA
ncbi:nuclear transport factor 2 family protein [Asticcacaulis sp. BYS171W]|uniref:Nuclear transport factor 2 family protein n=1 Tax=Asticcacaulis aquaticus TaxID=2984212 RepID=A0ABT5HVJ0_9CAUL|nr:nuclear transport factor 2 family protein [Asticcacaulis aquaticus]MDC7684107.1 nuclear transport factor 2 family protein [Asticcacaulis aquaticus]